MLAVLKDLQGSGTEDRSGSGFIVQRSQCDSVAPMEASGSLQWAQRLDEFKDVLWPVVREARADDVMVVWGFKIYARIAREDGEWERIGSEEEPWKRRDVWGIFKASDNE